MPSSASAEPSSRAWPATEATVARATSRSGRSAAVVQDRGVQAVPAGAKARLPDRLGREPCRRRGLQRLRRQRLHQRGQRRGVLERGLHVHLAHLDRPEPRVRARVPPDERVVVELPRRPRGLHRLSIFVPAGEEAGHSAARIRAHDREPRAREAGVRAEPVRAVRAQPLQQREVGAQPVQHLDRRVRIGSADVHVQRAFGRAPDQAAHRLVERRGSAPCRSAARRPMRADGCRPAAISVAPAARAAARAASSAPRGLGSVRQTGVRSSTSDANASCAASASGSSTAPSTSLGDVRELVAVRIDQQQLLLHAEGERVGIAEGVLHGRATYPSERGFGGDPPEHEGRGQPARVSAGRDAAGVGAGRVHARGHARARRRSAARRASS